MTCHTGNALVHSFSLGRSTGVMLGMSGMPVSYSPGTVDQRPKHLSSHLMYANWWGFAVPDIERTDLLVVMGANPAASQGSLLAIEDERADGHRCGHDCSPWPCRRRCRTTSRS